MYIMYHECRRKVERTFLMSLKGQMVEKVKSLFWRDKTVIKVTGEKTGKIYLKPKGALKVGETTKFVTRFIVSKTHALKK